MPESDVSTPSAPPGAVWHYALDDKAFGPVEAGVVHDLIARGVADGATLVWREGWPAWRAMADTPEFSPALPKPAIPERRLGPEVPRIPTDRTSMMRLVVRRIGAALIDQLVLLVPGCAIGTPLLLLMLIRGKTLGDLFSLTPSDPEMWIMFATSWGIQWVYEALMVSSRLRATLGKRVCGLVVTDHSGHGLSFGQASLRYWMKLPSAALFPPLYCVALATGGVKCLHDIIARTLVWRRARE